MRSEATSAEAYLAELPPDRRSVIEAVRRIILGNLPSGYEEAMNWGMITYEVPLAVNPKTYNGKPLMYAALANQKNHMAVYLSALSCMPGGLAAFQKNWKARKLDMGVGCVRFKRLEDLDLDSIARVIAATPVAKFVEVSKR